jgi:isopenicillin-N epimerase
MTNPLAAHWTLESGLDFLNHGSFGACPATVQAEHSRLRAELERQPMRFLVDALEDRLAAARVVLGTFVGADPDDLAFVTNATEGVNTVLAGVPLEPGHEVLVTDHAYNACRNAAVAWAERRGASVRVARVPFPVASADALTEAVLAAVTPRTRLAMLDHVTSPTALVFPVQRLVAELAARGVDTLIDGAHAPGMLPLELGSLGATYYTGNLHKWVCAPKGAAFLWVRRDAQAHVRPLVISHGANDPRPGRSRFRKEFDWTGTRDVTAWLAVPAALAFLEGLLPGGFPALAARNHALALQARDVLCQALRIPAPAPDDLLGSMATVPLPVRRESDGPAEVWQLRHDLLARHRVEVPLFAWPAAPHRLLRVSLQAYNDLSQVERLALSLLEELARE